MKRREFVKTALFLGSAMQFPHVWIEDVKAESDLYKLTILQTNDTHSRIDPFPMNGSKFQGLGGIARRATLVKKIRQENPNTLLLDAGDVFQGTPYFNFYKGKVEFVTMSLCGYNAITLGNHEFDNGIESLVTALQYTNFPIVNCNYDLGDSLLKSHLKKYMIRQFGPIKVGITGVGIDFTDMVALDKHKGVNYIHPIKPLQEIVNYLRDKIDCSCVIVLSHLGYKYESDKVSDVVIAREVDGIDWIVSGHTHTFMRKPDIIISKKGHVTRILQVGWAGVVLGKSDLFFDREKLVKTTSAIMEIDSQVKESSFISEYYG